MKSRPLIETLSLYALVGLIALSIADLGVLYSRTNFLPTPPPKSTARRVATRRPPPDRSTYNVVTTRNIFNPDGKIPDPHGAGPKVRPEDPPVPSTLPLQLMGTIVHVNPKRSVASISLKNKNDMIATKVDDIIPDNLATVTKIERNKVYFRNNMSTRLEYIEMKDDTKLISVSSNRGRQEGEVKVLSDTDRELKRDDVNKLTNNLPELLQQARAIQNYGPNGQPNGFRVMDLQPGSIYERLGIKRGDVITGVNGDPVDSPAKAMELYNALRTSSNINLQIERNGRRETLNFNITN